MNTFTCSSAGDGGELCRADCVTDRRASCSYMLHPSSYLDFLTVVQAKPSKAQYLLDFCILLIMEILLSDSHEDMLTVGTNKVIISGNNAMRCTGRLASECM